MKAHMSRLKTVVLTVLALSIGGSDASPINTKGKDASEYKVDSLPGLDKLDEIPIMHAGQLEVDYETDTHYFFWKFQKPAGPVDNRTIFWLNGGPGCSSMDGALMEVGPLRINEDLDVEFNNGSWYELGDLVFVDQPGGTGFSYTNKYSVELVDVAENFIKFLEHYFTLFPEDLANDLYLAGESYAGQYIPYIAKLIAESDKHDYNLKGLLIGNGWIAPNEQSLTYIPFFLQAGLISKSDHFFSELLKQQEACQNLISKGENTLVSQCEQILESVLAYTRDEKLPKDEQCINMYDYTLRDSYPSCGMNWPPLLPEVTRFLNKDENMKLLNLKKFQEWHECDSNVSKFLKLKHSKQAIEYLPELLTKFQILLFNGNRDIICNYMGTELMIANMEWAGSRGFSDDVDTLNWYYDNATLGTVRSLNNLTYINVYNASHMVPFDNSAVSRGVFDILIGNVDNFEDGISTPVYKSGSTETKIDEITLNAEASNGTSSSSEHGADDKNHDDSLSLSHSATFYVFELIVVFIILYGIHYFYKYYNDISSQRPASILHNGTSSNKKSKKVHWFDEMDFENQDTGFNEDHINVDSDSKKGLVGNIWSKFSNSYTKVPTNNKSSGSNEDIEMSGGQVEDASREEFIIESEDEQDQVIPNGNGNGQQ